MGSRSLFLQSIQTNAAVLSTVLLSALRSARAAQVFEFVMLPEQYPLMTLLYGDNMGG